MKQGALFILICVFSIPTWGETVELAVPLDRIEIRGGALLTGSIEQSGEHTIRLKTSYAGVVEVDVNQVEKITSSRPLKGLVPDRFIREDSPKPTVAKASTPKPPKEKLTQKEGWSVEAGMNLGGKRGNTEKFDFTVTVDSRFQRKFDRFDLYGRYAYGTNREKLAVDESIIGGRYTNFFFDRVGLFIREEMEHDELEGILYRSTSASGLSWKVQNNEGLNIEARSGISYRYDNFKDDGYETYPGMDLGMDILWKISDWVKFKGSYTILPSVDNVEDYTLEQDSSVDFSLDYWNRWSLRFGVWSKYNNAPDTGREGLDVRYYARVISTWK